MDLQYQVAGSPTSEKVWDLTLMPCGVGGLVDGLTTVPHRTKFALLARVGLHDDFTDSMLKANRWTLLKKLEKVELN